MKLTKAIEILTSLLMDRQDLSGTDLANSINLGIEALKCIKEHRAEFGNIPFIHLPGETEETANETH